VAQDPSSQGYDPATPENVYCPECGHVISVKMLAVHRNRLHNVPMPIPPPRAPGTPDPSVPLWISDKEVPPQEPETATGTDDEPAADDDDVPEHEHELPAHEHEEYKGFLSKQDNELTTLKLAIAHLDRKLADKENEIVVLQGMIDEVVKKEEENEMATATPVAIYDTEEKRVVAMHLLYKSKGQKVETILRALVDAWHKEPQGVEFAGLPPNMSLRLKGDASERGFDMVPSTMLVLRVTKKERTSLEESLLSQGLGTPAAK
jgi:hypothetical protein